MFKFKNSVFIFEASILCVRNVFKKVVPKTTLSLNGNDLDPSYKSFALTADTFLEKDLINIKRNIMQWSFRNTTASVRGVTCTTRALDASKR